MFDPMDFENSRAVTKYAGETILADAKFLERPACQWLKIVRWVAPSGSDYFV